MKQKTNVLSLVTGILMILGGGFGLVSGIIAVADSLPGFHLVSAIISLISSVGILAVGIIYALNARKPEKAAFCKAIGMPAVLFRILGAVVALWVTGFDTVSFIMSMFLPGLYLLGCIPKKKRTADNGE